MEPEGSLPHAQVPATCPHPDPVHTPTSHFLKSHLNIILPSMPWSPQRSLSFWFPHQGPVRRVHTCNVTVYCNTVLWQCGRDLWPRNVPKVGYAVTSRACSVCCQYLVVASKGWYGYGLSRSVCATCLVTTIGSSAPLFIPDASVLKCGANV
jgi:hypothetical protein